MKLKRLPEDFEVTELTDVRPHPAGPFTLYLLTKRSIGTLEAVETILRMWDLPRAALSFGGLKDRHALTRQHLTIHGGPPEDLEQDGLTLQHLGCLDRPFTAQDMNGNRFKVVLRALPPSQERTALAALPEVARDGVPNAFDDQRFGSVTENGEYVGRPWIAGDYEATLRVAFAEPNSHDTPKDREQKRILRDGWGDWKGLKASLDRSHLRSVITFLADRPGDFKGAVAVARQDLRSLWLAAFQSHLWNRILAVMTREVVPPEDRMELDLRGGPVVFWQRLSDSTRELLQQTELPLPCSRNQIEPGPMLDLVERSLAEEGLTLRMINVRHPRGSFFSRGRRPAVLRPRDLVHDVTKDELYPGCTRLNLAFDLPRSAYATMIVKRLTAAAAPRKQA